MSDIEEALHKLMEAVNKRHKNLHALHNKDVELYEVYMNCVEQLRLSSPIEYIVHLSELKLLERLGDHIPAEVYTKEVIRSQKINISSIVPPEFIFDEYLDENIEECKLSDLEVGDIVRIDTAQQCFLGHWSKWTKYVYQYLGFIDDAYLFENVKYKYEHFSMKGDERMYEFYGKYTHKNTTPYID